MQDSRPNDKMIRERKGWQWMRPFVEEPVSVKDDDIAISRWRLPWTTLVLVLLSITGLAAQIIVSIHKPATSALSVLWGVAILLVAFHSPRTGSVPASLVYAALFATQITLLLYNGFESKPELDEIAGYVSPFASFASCVVQVNLPLREPSWPHHEHQQAFHRAESSVAYSRRQPHSMAMDDSVMGNGFNQDREQTSAT